MLRREIKCSVGVLERLMEKPYLSFVGSGGAFEHENTTAYRIIDDTLVLIDIGELNTHKVIQLIKSNSKVNRVRILITHSHMDHIGGLSTVLYYLRYVSPITDVKVYTGIGVEIEKYLDVSGINKDVFDPEVQLIRGSDRNQELLIARNLEKGSEEILSARFINTNHVSNMMAYAILLRSHNISEDRVRHLLYSGDSCEIVHPGCFVDEHYQDVSSYDTPVHLHYSAYLQAMLYKPRPTKTFAIHNINYKPDIEFMSLERLLDIQSDTCKHRTAVEIPFELRPDMIFDTKPGVGNGDLLKKFKEYVELVPVEHIRFNDDTGLVMVKVYHETTLHALSVIRYYQRSVKMGGYQDTEKVFTLFTNNNTRHIIEEFGCFNFEEDYTEYGENWEDKVITELHNELGRIIRTYRK